MNKGLLIGQYLPCASHPVMDPLPQDPSKEVGKMVLWRLIFGYDTPPPTLPSLELQIFLVMDEFMC